MRWKQRSSTAPRRGNSTIVPAHRRLARLARQPNRVLLLIAVVVLGAEGVRGQSRVTTAAGTSSDVSLREIDNESRAHLERAEALLASGEWAEAVQNLRRVMDVEDRLIRVASRDGGPGFVHFLPARDACQIRLCRLHETAPEALQLYRRQVDGLAQRWFDEALAERDAAQLERVVDQYFASSVGDDALYWLGEDAFARGEFRRARGFWERISPSFRLARGAGRDAEAGLSAWLLLRLTEVDRHWEALRPLLSGGAAPANWLTYPDADRELAAVRARLVLASLMQGDTRRAARELDVLRRLAPRAEGVIGGQRGRYADLLAALLDQSRSWPPLPASPDWPTFGGSPRRSKTLAHPIDVGGRPLWETPLARHAWQDDRGRANRLRVAEDAQGLLVHHPIVVGDLVIVGDDDRQINVRALDLRSGREVFPGADRPARPHIHDNRSARGVPRFTWTASGRIVFARVAMLTSQTDSQGRPIERLARLVALDAAAQRKLLFEVRLAPPEWEGTWVFEGPPVTDGAFLYVAVRRQDDVRSESHVACFDARQGRFVWRQFVSAASSFDASGVQAAPNNLLTLDEGLLYYNTNAGCIASLRARDGRLRWITKYPRSASDGRDADGANQHAFRDLNPCLVAGDLVYAAPADCRRLFALDAITGQWVWSTPADLAADATHLLGVGEGQLIAGGDCLYWLDAYSGRLSARFPAGYDAASGHARPSPRGHGRGLLAGQQVYWPTRDSIYVFRQKPVATPLGGQPQLVRELELSPRGAVGGNLLAAGGVLLVAAADRLYAFDEFGRAPDAANRRRPGRREVE